MQGSEHPIDAFPFGEWSFPSTGGIRCSIDDAWLSRWSVSSPDQRIAMLAAGQRGRVTTRQLLDAGLGRKAIHHRVACGRLHRLHQGVYAVGHLGPVRLGDEAAALLACGPRATLSHRTAAAVWRLIPETPAGVIDVTVLPSRRLRRRGIRVHRSELGVADATEHSGLPVTTPQRTILDCAAVLAQDELDRVVAEGQALRLVTVDELRLPPGAAGAARLRSAAAGQPGVTRSDAERRFRALVTRAGLPPPRTNVRLAGHSVDAVWREHRVVVEIDGFGAHGSRRAFEADRRRDLDLRDAGMVVARFSYRQLTDEPERVLAHLAGLLARADAR